MSPPGMPGYAAPVPVARPKSRRGLWIALGIIGGVLLIGIILFAVLILGGLLLALSALKLTHAVLSILGLAGVVGLAVGFAFRDITENFIASVLLVLVAAGTSVYLNRSTPDKTLTTY